ncbi:MAG: Erythromycin esterase [Rhodocyclaceae bacterium]|nr:Erythromycin esterase [Rhodocyclaceae bacterium]
MGTSIQSTSIAGKNRRRRLLAAALPWLLALPALAEPAPSLPDRAETVAAIRAQAGEITGQPQDYDALLASIGAARLVLLGEGTHGSAEFYRERARITRRLIAEKGFDTVILESGWAPAARLDAYVRGRSADRSSGEALRDYRRFPGWTWRNAEFAAFLEELRAHNAALPPGRPRVALYGMDIYEAPEAAVKVVDYLRTRDATAARRAKGDYRCFAPYRRQAFDPMYYGRDVARGWMPSCEKRVGSRVEAVRRLAAEAGDDAGFAALLGARTVHGAEAYYRAVYGRGGSWNVRERHLAESIDLILGRHGKAVVWAHNTHQGDARATGYGAAGLLTIGQLARERYGEEAVFLVGLTTAAGTVRAASGWATTDRVKELAPAHPDSWQALFHDVGLPAFLLDFRRDQGLAGHLEQRRPDRAIGVNYFPDAEEKNHYHPVRPARAYDALIHIDLTRAVQPLP